MPVLTIDLARSDADYLEQVCYALTFVSEDVISYNIDEGSKKITLELTHNADESEVRARVDEILIRYDRTQFGMKTVVEYERKRDLPSVDAWAGMVERKWATPVGEGHVVLRGPAALLMALVDYKVETMFARGFAAELEYFPSTIRSETLPSVQSFHIVSRAYPETGSPGSQAFRRHLSGAGMVAGSARWHYGLK